MFEKIKNAISQPPAENSGDKKEKVNWAEMREGLYKKIEEKVKVILDLRKFADDNKNTSHEELKDSIEKKMQAIVDNLKEKGAITDEHEKNLLHQLSLKFESDELKEKMHTRLDELNDGNLSNLEFGEAIYNDETYQNYKKREQEIENELSAIQDNIDLVFLRKATFFLNDVLSKRELVKNCEKLFNDNPDTVYDYIQDKSKLDLRRIDQSKQKIKFSGYSIVVELDQDAFNEFAGNEYTNGYNIKDSVIIILKNREGKESTLNHESNHNLSESFTEDVSYTGHLLFSLKFKLNGLQNLIEKEDDNNSKLIENLKKDISETIRDYVYENFSEIIADIDNIADREIRTFFSNFFGTLDELEKLTKETENEELKKIIDKSIDEMKKKFIEYIDKITNVFFVSDIMNEKELAKGAIILFKHKEIDKVEKFIANHFGKEKYDVLIALKPLICQGAYFSDEDSFLRSHLQYKMIQAFEKGGDIHNLDIGKSGKFASDFMQTNLMASFFTEDNLRKVIELIEKNKIEITDDVRQKIINSLGKMNTTEIAINTKEVDDLVKVDKLLKQLSNLTGIEELYDYADKLGYGLISFMAELYLAKSDYKELVERYKNWPFDKKAFQSAISSIFFKKSEEERKKSLRDDEFTRFLKEVEML